MKFYQRDGFNYAKQVFNQRGGLLFYSKHSPNGRGKEWKQCAWSV